MNLKYFLIILSFIFILINIFLAVLIYNFIIVSPSFSISLSSNYTFPYVDTKNSLILPGSMVVLATSNTPGFSINLDRPTFLWSTGIGYLLLSLSIFFIILGIALIITYEENNIVYGLLLILLSPIIFALSIVFNSPSYPGDILCYKKQIHNHYSYICHKYIYGNSTNVVLLRVYDNSTEVIPIQEVTGKIVYNIPPPVGTLLFIYKSSLDFISTLYDIITKGNIPLGYKVEYIKVE